MRWTEEESEDEEEAFNDLEDETMLCADYVPQTRNKRLPDAIIIGARKVQRKMMYIETDMTVWTSKLDELSGAV